MNHHRFIRNAAIIVVCISLILPIAQCKKKSDPARFLINVDGKLFSDAMVIINGKQAGKMMQTLIQPDGQLFIDGQYTATLPAGHHDIPDDARYSGALDSVRLEPGQHTIILRDDDGHSLQVTVRCLSGLHTITYNSDTHILNWNSLKVSALAGETIHLK